MLMTDYTAKLLDLEDVIITKAENISDQLHIRIDLPRKELSARSVGRSLPVSATIAFRSSRIYP